MRVGILTDGETKVKAPSRIEVIFPFGESKNLYIIDCNGFEERMLSLRELESIVKTIVEYEKGIIVLVGENVLNDLMEGC